MKNVAQIYDPAGKVLLSGKIAWQHCDNIVAKLQQWIIDSCSLCIPRQHCDNIKTEKQDSLKKTGLICIQSPKYYFTTMLLPTITGATIAWKYCCNIPAIIATIFS